jgi:acylglycerol lipase
MPVSAPDSLRESTATVTSADGTPLFRRTWLAAGARDVVVIVPGIGLHGAPYRVVAEALVPAGHHVVALDLRGHGKSGGRRGAVPTPREVVMDLDAMLDAVRAELAPQRVHLLGESMGGLVALNYVAVRSARLASLILVAPAIRVACGQILRADSVCVTPGLVAPCRPVLDVAGARLDEATADEDFKRARRADPLALNVLSVGYLLALARLRVRWRAKARRATAPTLIFHGRRDAILDWRGSCALERALGARVRELVLLDSARHTLFWDPASAEVFARIRGWLAARAR